MHTIHRLQSYVFNNPTPVSKSTMDRTEEDMKLVGFFGIFNQSFKTIFKSKKIFAQIILCFMLLLTGIVLANKEISHHLFNKIEGYSIPYDDSTNAPRTSTPTVYYWLYQIAFSIVLTVYSVLYTAALVFATATSVYTDRELVFRQVLRIVPKLLKKLLITFVFTYCALFIYLLITSIVVAVIFIFTFNSSFGIILFSIILILFLWGVIYLIVVCQLANVVTVLENVYGFKAVKKGKHLLKGKKMVGMGTEFVLYVVLIGLILVYVFFVDLGDVIFELPTIWRTVIGLLTGVVTKKVSLLIVVSQTVLYLVCKSHHNEAIDKLRLSTFLDGNVEETVVYPKPHLETELGRT